MTHRLLFITVALAVFMVPVVTVWGGGSSAALACSGSGFTFDEIFAGADSVFIGEVVDVGGTQNEAPTVTPFPTATPTATRTASGSGSPTRTLGLLTVTATDTPPPPRAARAFDLAGRRATLDVLQIHAGTVRSRVVVDAGARRRTEELIRASEGTGRIPVCGYGGPFQYSVGGRYLVLTQVVEGADGTPDVSTWFRWRVVGDDAILADGSFAQSDRAYLSVTATTYDRYFSGADGQVSGEGSMVYIQSARVPVASLLAAILGTRSGSRRIVPPETGSGGMAARQFENGVARVTIAP